MLHEKYMWIKSCIRLYFKTSEKIARWRHWNIWRLSVKTNIYLLFRCLQGSQECQKIHNAIIHSTGIWRFCALIFSQNWKKLWHSTKNQSSLRASGGFLKFIQFWLNIRAPNFQVQLVMAHRLTPLGSLGQLEHPNKRWNEYLWFLPLCSLSNAWYFFEKKFSSN